MIFHLALWIYFFCLTKERREKKLFLFGRYVSIGIDRSQNSTFFAFSLVSIQDSMRGKYTACSRDDTPICNKWINKQIFVSYAHITSTPDIDLQSMFQENQFIPYIWFLGHVPNLDYRTLCFRFVFEFIYILRSITRTPNIEPIR